MLLPPGLTVFACGIYALFIPFYASEWTMVPWSSEFAMMFQVVALYALCQVICGKQPLAWALVLGLSSACVFWCRQPVGILLCGALVAIGVVLLRAGWVLSKTVSMRATITATGFGFILTNALLLGGIALSGALPSWWYQNFVWPKRWALQDGEKNWGLWAPVYVHPARGFWLLSLLLALAAPGLINRMKPVFSLGGLAAYYAALIGILVLKHEWADSMVMWPEGGWSTVIPFALVLQTAVLTGWLCLRKTAARLTEDYLLLAISGVALAAMAQYYPVPCARHIFWSLAPSFGLFVHLVWRWTGWRPFVVLIVLGCALGPMISAKIASARDKLTQPLETLSRPAILCGMRVTTEEAHGLELIDATLRRLLDKAPMTPSALIGNDALFLCFTPNRNNPSPYFVTWPGLLSAEQKSDRWNRILEMRPILFVQKPIKEAAERFYESNRYVPLLHISGGDTVVAAPAELVLGATKRNEPAK